MEISGEIFEQELRDLFIKLDHYFNYTVVNRDPLTKEIMPKETIKFYSVDNGLSTYNFETIGERESWILNNKPSFCSCFTTEYLGYVAGRDNVIRQSSNNGNTRLIAINDRYSYDIYNYEESKKRGSFVWNHFYDDNGDKYYMFSNISKKLEEKPKQKVR